MAKTDRFTAWLQERLNEQGYSLEVDGDNGPKTQAAIKDMQAALGLKQTGTATREFMDALKGLRMAGPARLEGNVASPMGQPPNVSGRMQMTPPMPRLRPPQGGAQASGMGMPPDSLIGPTGRSGLDLPPSGGLTPEMLMDSQPAPGPNREMIARALAMPLGGGASPSAMAMPPMQGAAGPGAGVPLGAPSGVPMTGPGGSPAPQYPPPNIISDVLTRTGLGNAMIPGYAERSQQPLPDYSTANSPLAGAESYQPPDQAQAMPPTQSVPPSISPESFSGRFNSQPPSPMQAGMVPPEMMEMIKRQLLQQLMQMQGR